MGTRSLTRVAEGKTQIINMYRQMDGYPSGHGMDLYEFLKPFQIVNGFSSDSKKKTVANGAGCLAAQLVAHFKTDVGGFYLEPVTAKDCGQEYEYKVIVNDDMTMTVEVVGYGKKLFCGTVDEFGKFCAKERIE